jgi:uroporphyrin-III C-methyltransferase/precorrin-2 dehydrogenase/sirohydrochlorin ferrochelatase
MSDAHRRPAPAVPALFPAFLRLTGKRVLVVGAGPVAASKLKALIDAEADITVVAPDVHADIEASPVTIHRRPFAVSDLDDVWYVVAAAPPEVNRAVSAAAAARHLFVNAVDDPPNASVYLGAIVKREDVIIAISTSGRAPALAGLLREGLDRLLPADLDAWLRVADDERLRWKAAGIPMEARRPELLRALNAIYVGHAHHEGQVEPAAEAALFGPATTPESSSSSIRPGTTPESSATIRPGETSDTTPESSAVAQGLVSLVGAGPGDPELLTARAHRRLAEADVVLYDSLVSPAVLALARHARCLSVGKRHGRHSVSQDTINRLLVRGARRRQRLVRLKAGDPYVFGRGGEEALALAAAGLPFEIVPGVSSAIAAPALAGIPVTHRGMASGVLVVSGHAESSYAPAIDSLAPKGTTLVVLMGVNTRAQIAGRLVARGWSGTTPVALLFAASTPDARTWIGTLGDLIAGAPLQLPESPGTLVVGDVVSLAATLAPAAPGGLHVTDSADDEPAASNE